jgi:adenine-specific DNA-methyltransferase
MPPAKKTKTNSTVAVDSIKHEQAQRANIPTEELRDFVPDDDTTTTTKLYPRNPDLDPQLVCKGKDAQDSADLAVPIVPIYIQEKIHPQAIVEDLRAASHTNSGGTADLFADFNGIAFEQLIEFYQHNQHWQNRMILGDSLLVMSSLAEKEALKGQVQMIYLDPPYGIKFGSNWQVSTRKRDVKDGKAEDATRQPEQIRAFRDTWQLGINSYLAYLRDRLVVARELLTESGSVFVQIGDENVHLVRSLLDEVFGQENFVGQIHFKSTTSQTSELIAGVGDYIIWFAKDKSVIKYRQIYLLKDSSPSSTRKYAEFSDLTRRTLTTDEQENFEKLASTPRLFVLDNLTSQSGGETTRLRINFQNNAYSPDPGFWKTNAVGMERLNNAKRLGVSGKTLRYVRFIDDFPVSPINILWTDTSTGSFTEDKIYVVQTNVKVIQRCLLMTTDPGDLVLDPTCGSGTTAYVAEQWGRRWITCDTSRVALALARTRLMAARYPYYYLADSQPGITKQAEVTGKLPLPNADPPKNSILKGFVYKTVPHVTLKAIANNSEIDDIHARWQLQLEPLRQQINHTKNTTWEEWEIPREADEQWPAQAKQLHEQWWQFRQQRQQEIDNCIARNADTETLFDQPYQDSKRVRVTGPFTVESLSPHRVLPTNEQVPAATPAPLSSVQFEPMILENLRRAGVQNTVKNERLKFDALDLYAGGVWIHGAGTYTDSAGSSKRVAVSIGPEHGTVGPEQVKEAAKEAVRGVGFDVLIVCGFAFDPHVGEESKRYGNLVVLPTRMNPDLGMSEDLLKKTGAGNLFMVFGEPDISPIDPLTGKIQRNASGQVQIQILGLDIYDPTTGQIRSNSTADIACWFVDTNYNGESFFVRHAYFTGGDEPYEKLQRALRADIDEAAWSALYSTTSRPFDPPSTGNIAVKVINHYGDEVLKVFGVA